MRRDVLLTLFSVTYLIAGQVAPGQVDLFDSDPNHIWNRTYACLLTRPTADQSNYGADALDPPLWSETRYLLTDESHRKALACLDEFLRNHAERQITDPLERAVFQRDLWSVFDWAAQYDGLPHERYELEERLAKVIHRIALTKREINALPDTYATAIRQRQFAAIYDPRNSSTPFLPADLFAFRSPWACISAFSRDPTALSHFSGRSRFLIFMRLPASRDATLSYVRKLRKWPDPPLIEDPSGGALLNLSVPQFPAETEVALVRQAILIDREGRLRPTTLAESIQIRVYRKITVGPAFMNYINGPSSHDQSFFEFRMSRRALFTHKAGGLTAVRPGDSEYATFSTHGDDPFESGHDEKPGAVLDRCRACHSDSGIQSVQSRIRWIHEPVATADRRNNEDLSRAIEWESATTVARKQQQADFRALQMLWQRDRE